MTRSIDEFTDGVLLLVIASGIVQDSSGGASRNVNESLNAS